MVYVMKIYKEYLTLDFGLTDGIYIAIAIDLDGRKDVLGIWGGENESSK